MLRVRATRFYFDFLDEKEGLGFRLYLADELIDVTLAGANASEVGDLSTVILSHVGYGNRI
jgi:hypothetical protein